MEISASTQISLTC